MMKPNRKWLLLLLGLVIVFIVDFPIIIVILNSFRTTETIVSSHSILPSVPTLANYFFINTRTHFWTFLLNSMIVAFTSSALAIVLAALAGFAMSRYRARILGGSNQALLIVQMFPLILAIIPLFIFFRNLNMVNNFTPVAIFSFLFSYNEFFISSVFLRDENRMTMPVGIQSFMQQYSTDWGSLMASATLGMVPTLILFFCIQKYMVAGATAGAVKG
jgi:ABC-type glycerol-3-phosphate transport system permease component